MDIPTLPTHPTKLILAVTTKHAAGKNIRRRGGTLGGDDTNLHPPLFSILLKHFGHSRVLALIHWAVPASSLVFFCHKATQ